MSELRADQARLALSASGMGTWRWDLKTGALTWDGPLERVFDLEPGSFDGTFEGYVELLHPDDREATLAAIRRSLSSGEEHRVEHRIIDRHGNVRWVAGYGRVTRDEDGTVTGMVGVGADITDRKRTEEELREKEAWIRRLQRITAAVAGAADVSAVAEVVIEQGVSTLGARAGVLALVDETGENLAIVADSGFGVGALDRWRSFPLETDIPVANAVRTGTPVWGVATSELATRPYVFGEVGEEAFGQSGMLVVVPLTTAGRTIGSLGLGFDAVATVSQQEREFLDALARQAAQAIDRAQLHEAERAARKDAERVVDRLARLQAVTSSLSKAATEREVAEVIVREGLVALRSDAGGVWLAEPVEGALRVIAAAGYPQDVEDDMRATPERPGPVAEAAATRDIVVVPTPEEFDERWPHLAELRAQVGDVTVAAAPMLLDERVLGVVYVAFRRAHTFDAEERGFLVTLARQCAQAIDRARLYEAERNRSELERTARAEADRARRRLQQLQAITEAGLAPLSLDDSLALMLERLRDAIACDAAAVLLLDEPGRRLELRAAVGFEGPRIPIRSVEIGSDVVGRVASSGTAEMLDDVGVAAVPPFEPGEIASVAVTPLRASGSVLGVLYTGTRAPRTFGPDDLELIDLAAERIAVAVDRANVFEREHRIAETLQVSLLPEALPEVPGVELAARYLAGGADVQVGGDWYEVVPLADGHLAAAVGDVVGRGIRAAAAMGQFRNAMRALALEGLSPARLLERLSELSIGLARGFATALALRLDPMSGVVTYSSAGHPPPLVLGPDGTPSLLDGGRSTPLGVEPGIAYPEAAAMLEPGSTLVLYTDGLIERRGEALDEGLQALLAAARGATDGVEDLLDRLLDRLAGEEQRDDDVALLALRYLHAPRRLELQLPSMPSSIGRFRVAVRDWLLTEGAGVDDVEDVALAVSEACSNAVEHAGVEGTDVTLTVEIRGDEIRLAVRDAGRWRPPHLRFERGRGFRILRAVMKDVQVTRRADGTEVRMRHGLRDGVAVR